MAECANCGRHVTDRYRRVFATNDGTLHGCPGCKNRGEVRLYPE